MVNYLFAISLFSNLLYNTIIMVIFELRFRKFQGPFFVVSLEFDYMLYTYSKHSNASFVNEKISIRGIAWSLLRNAIVSLLVGGVTATCYFYFFLVVFDTKPMYCSEVAQYMTTMNCITDKNKRKYMK